MQLDPALAARLRDAFAIDRYAPLALTPRVEEVCIDYIEAMVPG